MPKSQYSDFPARLAVRLAMRRYLVLDKQINNLIINTKLALATVLACMIGAITSPPLRLLYLLLRRYTKDASYTSHVPNVCYDSSPWAAPKVGSR